MLPTDTDTWTQWSKHVLKELERLNTKFEALQNDIQAIRTDRMKIDLIGDWKSSVEKEISVKDISQIKTDVDKLKIFKAQAITVWLVIQGAMAIATALSFKLTH